MSHWNWDYPLHYLLCNHLKSCRLLTCPVCPMRLRPCRRLKWYDTVCVFALDNVPNWACEVCVHYAFTLSSEAAASLWRSERQKDQVHHWALTLPLPPLPSCVSVQTDSGHSCLAPPSIHRSSLDVNLLYST